MCVSVCVCVTGGFMCHCVFPQVVFDSNASKTLPVVSSNGFQIQLLYYYVNR